MVYYYSKQRTFFNKYQGLDLSIIDSISEVYDRLKNEKEIALDTETTGLDPLKHKPIMLQLGTDKDQFVLDIRGEDISQLYPLFNTDILFIGHNIKFDYNMLKQRGIVLRNTFDTMLAEMVLENGKYSQEEIKNNKPFALKTLISKYLNIEMGKETREEFVSWGKTQFNLKQIDYGAKDVKYPFKIKRYQEELLNRYELEKTISLECKSSLALADIEYNGIYLDSYKWLEANKEFQKRLRSILVELDKILITKDPRFEKKTIQLQLFSDALSDKDRRLTDINWDSPIQVLKILTKIFNIYPRDKDGKLSSGAEALKLLESSSPIVDTLLKFRKTSKAVNTFGKKFLEDYRYKDGRIRTSFNSMVETGRVSSRKPNMQQIPKDETFRKCFVSEPGNRLITADYSNQEGRIMADRSGDKAYIDFFNHGDGDAHSFVARTMFSAAEGKFVDVRNDEHHPNYHLRQKGKILNFFISFGGSAHTLSSTLKIPKDEAQYLIDNFYKGFPGLKKMFTKDSETSLNKGYIRTNDVTKRIRWMRGWNKYQQLKLKKYHELSKEEFKEKSKLEGMIKRRGMNTPIQGTAGDMTKTALILIRNKLLKNGILPLQDAPIKLVNVVHDEIVKEASEEYSKLASNILKESMEKAGKYFCKRVEMPAEPVISECWKH